MLMVPRGPRVPYGVGFGGHWRTLANTGLTFRKKHNLLVIITIVNGNQTQ